MPSDRSMPSEITGEKAERTKARSISLQTWIRPFWMTVRVTGSRFDAGSDMGHAYHRSRVASWLNRDSIHTATAAARENGMPVRVIGMIGVAPPSGDATVHVIKGGISTGYLRAF